MTIGEFLLAVVEWVYEFWPIRIIDAWEQGVRMRAGNPTKLLTSENGWRGSGIHGFWPVVGEIISEEANACVIETSWQTLVTKDGKPVSFSLAARFRIRDLMKLYLGIHDRDETIENQLLAAAAAAIVTLNLSELDDKFADAVKDEAKRRLTEWGVTLLEVALVNRVEATNIRLLDD